MNKHLTEFFKQQAVNDLDQIVFLLLKGTPQQRTPRLFLLLPGPPCDNPLVFVQPSMWVGAGAPPLDAKLS